MKKQLVNCIEEQTVMLKSNACWPGFYGMQWDEKRKVMLIKGWHSNEKPFMWIDNRNEFMHLGEDRTLKEALNKNGNFLYSFDTYKELTDWMDS